MKEWLGKPAAPADAMKTDDPELHAAAACTTEVMRASLAQRKEFADVRAEIEACKAQATADAYRKAAALKKQADALAASIQELAMEFEAVDCIRKKCVAALQRARRLEEFDDAAVFAELLEKINKRFEFHHTREKEEQDQLKADEARQKADKARQKADRARTATERDTDAEPDEDDSSGDERDDNTHHLDHNRATNKYRLKNPGNADKGKGRIKASDKWPSNKCGRGVFFFRFRLPLFLVF
jgi:hypothetical protein